MKYLDVEIRDMTDSDLPMVMEIENLCFKHPYKEKDLIYEMHENPVSNVWVIEYSNASLGLKTVVGFVDYWVTFDSGTICQIAVHPDIQPSEVRESNLNAINFYEKHGFVISHKKPAYYSNGEDAIYMILEVK